MKKIFTLVCLVATVVACKTKSTLPVYLDSNRPIEERVEDALSRMTLDEKLGLVHAQSKFSSAGVKRLGIRELWCTDGPHGIRPEVLWDEWEQAGWTIDSCIAFPALSALAASWNPEMSALYGKAIGEEARYRGKNVLLGPGVNIYRTPLCGRNFEYMGEDPHLAGTMVVPYIQGVQSNGVATCVKHYALNNEETHRHTIDVDLDDRALYEIYLPAFKAAVDAGTWSIMSSYNLYRGQHVSHNHRMLCDILKGEWDFDGAVISDWGGVHDSDEAIHNGMDLEFGTWTDGLTMGKTNAYSAYYLADAYKEKILVGQVGTEELDDKCRRVLRLIFRTSMAPEGALPFGSLCSEEHKAVARQIAGEGIVLLKNDNSILPLSPAEGAKILVVGENAIKPMTVGGGSSSLKAQYEISPLDGIRERAGSGVSVEYQRGYVGHVLSSYNGVKLAVDLSDSRSREELLADAVAAAREADYVIFVGGLNKSRGQDSESRDRTELGLPYGQDELIAALSEACPKLAVVIVSGNAVAMPWVDNVPSIMQAWYLGSESGHAVADVLFGDVNPSGKLPFTFPVLLSDSPAHQEGMTFPNDGPTCYEEGIFVGYRWFENKGIRPLFAFGHGLSYTTFSLGTPTLSSRKISEGRNITLTVPVTNTGSVGGKEVVQVYVKDDECSLPRPLKELKGFAKVEVEPGCTAKAVITLKADDFKFFDAEAHKWVLEAGTFTLCIGNSSDNILYEISVEAK